MIAEAIRPRIQDYLGLRSEFVKKVQLIHTLLRVAEILLLPLTIFGGWWLGITRRYGTGKLPLTRAALLRIGVFVIRDHYYEPQFKFGPGPSSEWQERTLPGVDLNAKGQLDLLRSFHFQQELLRFPMNARNAHEFYYRNNMLEAGDAEYLYSLVRMLKPSRVMEVGCGFSTLMFRNAIQQNKVEDKDYECEHTCIEPFENPWLADIGVNLVRQRVEQIPWANFAALQANDILFLDSSHMIRPGGDVLYECLEILPRLNRGVYVHVHDIFTPFEYPDRWIREDVRFWNEQYLLEGFLSCNPGYTIVGALCFLSRRFPQELVAKFPILATTTVTSRPASFWIRKS